MTFRELIDNRFIEVQVEQLLLAGFSDDYIIDALVRFGIVESIARQALAIKIRQLGRQSAGSSESNEDRNLIWIDLASTLVVAIALDRERNETVVRFKDGGSARYSGRFFELLRTASSPGALYNFAMRGRSI